MSAVFPLPSPLSHFRGCPGEAISSLFDGIIRTFIRLVLIRFKKCFLWHCATMQVGNSAHNPGDYCETTQYVLISYKKVPFLTNEKVEDYLLIRGQIYPWTCCIMLCSIVATFIRSDDQTMFHKIGYVFLKKQSKAYSQRFCHLFWRSCIEITW